MTKRQVRGIAALVIVFAGQSLRADLPDPIPGKGDTWAADAGSSHGSHPASDAINGNTGNFWQGTTRPTWHRIDMGDRYRVTHYQFIKRNTGGHEIKDFEIYVTDSSSTSLGDWGTPVAQGTLPAIGVNWYTIELLPRNGRYVIMRAITVDSANATLADVQLLGYDEGPVMAVSPNWMRMYTDTIRAVSFPGIDEADDPFETIQADLVVSDPDDIFETLVLDETDVTSGGADLLTYTSAGPADEGDLTVTTSDEAGFGTIHVIESSSGGYTPQVVPGEFISIESVERLVRVNGTTTIGLNLNSSDTRKIEIVDAELGAPGNITVSIGTHTGTSATATADGTIDILNEAFTSDGSIAFDSEETAGITTIEVTVNNGFIFEETGTDTVTFEVVVLSTDAVFVREDGDDDTGDGSAAAPFRTLTKALQYTPGISTVDIGPGLYDEEVGESFPVIVPDGTSIIGPADASAILDADHAEWVMHVQDSATTEEIAGLTLRRGKGTILRIGNWAGTLRHCVLTDVENGGAFDETSILNYNNGNNNRALTLDNVTVSNVTANVRHFMRFIGTGPLTITNSHFRDLTTSVASRQHHGNIAIRNSSTGSVGPIATISDTIFEDITVTATSGGHSEGGFLLIHRGTTHRIERCIFRNISFEANTAGDWLLAGHNATMTVENSLFHHVHGGSGRGAVIGGWNSYHNVHNCTFDEVNVPFRQHGSSHVIAVYNSSLSNFDQLNRGGEGLLYLTNVNLYDTPEPEGAGYSAISSANVTRLDPLFRNAAAGDYRLAPYSPLVDVGDNTFAQGATDLAGFTRVHDGLGDGTATVDIGAYESSFGVYSTPTFTTPHPVYNLFAGNDLVVPVGIDPAAAGAVTAAFTYGDDLSGPATLDIPDGEGPVNLTISAPATLTVPSGTMSLVTIGEGVSSQGVETNWIGITLLDYRVTVNQPDRLYIREGNSVEVYVSLELLGAEAPADLTITPGGIQGAGSSSATWIGDAWIPEGESVSQGYLALTGGDGFNTVDLTIGGGFVFAESNTATLTLEIVGHPGWLYVDSVAGDDDNTGTLAEPHRTIGFAASQLSDGDTVRVLPGTYGPSSGETLPIEPGGVAVLGYNPNGPVDIEAHVLDGEDATHILRYLVVSGDNPGLVGNLHIRDSANAAILVDASTLTVTNALFTQATTATSVGGAILMRNDSQVTVHDSVFRGMNRRAVVLKAQMLQNTDNNFFAFNCLFEDNVSDYGTVATLQGYGSGYLAGRFFLTDCIFRNNQVPTSTLGDSYRGAAVYIWGRSDMPSTLQIERCQFIGNSGGNLFGISNTAGTKPRASNSLFAGNDNPGNMFYGYSWGMDFINCTFVGNSGGYAGRAATRANGVHIRNSIIRGDNELTFQAPNGQSAGATNLRLIDTILYDTPLGEGYNTGNSSNVIEEDPQFRVMPDPFDAEFLDATLRPRLSPAVNAGNNAVVVGDFDLNGGPRILHDIVDLGAYEAFIPPEGTVILVR